MEAFPTYEFLPFRPADTLETGVVVDQNGKVLFSGRDRVAATASKPPLLKAAKKRGLAYIGCLILILIAFFSVFFLIIFYPGLLFSSIGDGTSETLNLVGPSNQRAELAPRSPPPPPTPTRPPPSPPSPRRARPRRARASTSSTP